MPTEPKPPADAVKLAPRWRRLISVLVIFHLTAVVIGPLEFATRMRSDAPSPVAASLRSAFAPYVDAAFLGHGYSFFAPEVGPSHLIRAKMEFDDGREPIELVFPDRRRQWPRLLYHRHFMLAEALQASFVSPEPPVPPPSEIGGNPRVFREEEASWRRGRAQYLSLRSSMENHLKKIYGADRVHLTRVEHALPSHYLFLENRRQLYDPESYLPLDETPTVGERSAAARDEMPTREPISRSSGPASGESR